VVNGNLFPSSPGPNPTDNLCPECVANNEGETAPDLDDDEA
jgi:hypothetical protein